MALDDATDKEFAQLPRSRSPANDNVPNERSIDQTVENDKPVGLVGAIKKFSAWDWTKIVGLGTASGLYISWLINPFTGFLNMTTSVASYVAAHFLIDKEKITKNNLQSEIQLAQTMAPIGSTLLKGVSLLPGAIPKILAGLFALPFAVSTYNALSYPIRKYTPSTFIKNIHRVPQESYENMKANFVPVATRSFFVGIVPYSLIVNFVPLDYQLATQASLRPINRYFIRKAEKDPHMIQAANDNRYAADKKIA